MDFTSARKTQNPGNLKTPQRQKSHLNFKIARHHLAPPVSARPALTRGLPREDGAWGEQMGLGSLPLEDSAGATRPPAEDPPSWQKRQYIAVYR